MWTSRARFETPLARPTPRASRCGSLNAPGHRRLLRKCYLIVLFRALFWLLFFLKKVGNFTILGCYSDASLLIAHYQIARLSCRSRLLGAIARQVNTDSVMVGCKSALQRRSSVSWCFGRASYCHRLITSVHVFFVTPSQVKRPK